MGPVLKPSPREGEGKTHDNNNDVAMTQIQPTQNLLLQNVHYKTRS